MGTLGNNLAHGDTANDHPAVMLTIGAHVIATGPNGSRSMNVSMIFQGLYATALEQNEILTEIQLLSTGSYRWCIS